MRMNFKQEELVRDFLSDVRKKFPEVEFLNVTESPENPEDLWINLTEPETEEREDELIEFAGDKTTDILLNYGYYITIMTRKKAPQMQQMCMA